MSIQPPDTFPLTFYRDNCADQAIMISRMCSAHRSSASSVVLVTGTGLSHDPGPHGDAAPPPSRARGSGARVVVDIDYRPGAVGLGLDHFGANVRTLLRQATLAVGTEEEVAAASGDARRRWRRRRAPVVARARGAGAEARRARGCDLSHRDSRRVRLLAAFPITVLNALGAGDAFASGLLYGWLQGWPLSEPFAWAAPPAAIVVTRHGCANFMPTLPEVEEFVASHRGLAIRVTSDELPVTSVETRLVTASFSGFQLH